MAQRIQVLQMKRRKKREIGPFKINGKTPLIFLLGCTLGWLSYPSLNPSWQASKAEAGCVQVCFSPGGKCTQRITEAIREAKNSIWVMAYSFTSPEIADALIDAHRRGLDVRILIEKSQLRDTVPSAEPLWEKECLYGSILQQGLRITKR